MTNKFLNEDVERCMCSLDKFEWELYKKSGLPCENMDLNLSCFDGFISL